MKRYISLVWILVLPFFLVPMILTAENEEFEFSHQYHQEMGISDCSTCHAAATESTTGEDDLLPGAESCEVCHGDAVTPPTDLPRITDYQKIFSHQQHAVQENIECVTCHEGISEDEKITADHLPVMEDCYTCHASDVKQVPDDCRMCHGPEERLEPKTHTASWQNFHGLPASKDRQECETCHVRESFCQDCHFGDNVVNQTHPVNWEFSHGLEARQQSSDCSSCHESQQFCAECHQANLVMPVNHSLPNWATRQTGGQHADEAAMDIDNCASCHTNPGANPVCLDCHSLGKSN